LIVLDASAVIELLLNTPAAASIAGRIFAPQEWLHAPNLIDLEVTQVLRRWTCRLRRTGGGHRGMTFHSSPFASSVTM
jgi:predicted nucleic acid-binding protein